MSDGQDAAYFEGLLLEWQGLFAAAYEQYEIAWSRRHSDRASLPEANVALHCALMAVRLDRIDEAERWIPRIASDYWKLGCRILRQTARVHLGLRVRDPISTRSALTDLDEAMSGVQHNNWAVQVVAVAVPAICLDSQYGDPQQATHPAVHRLADFPRGELNFLTGRQSWTRAVLSHRLAALRYAAGMPPDEDYFGRPSPAVPVRSEATLPAEIPARTTAARAACDKAMAVAHQLDELSESAWRQKEVANLRRRIEYIAGVHGV